MYEQEKRVEVLKAVVVNLRDMTRKVWNKYMNRSINNNNNNNKYFAWKVETDLPQIYINKIVNKLTNKWIN